MLLRRGMVVCCCLLFSLVLTDRLDLHLSLSWLGESAWNSRGIQSIISTIFTLIFYVIKDRLSVPSFLRVGTHLIKLSYYNMILTLISVCNNLVSSGANKPWRLGFGNFLASWTDSSKTYDFGGKLGIRYIYHETISDFPQGFLEFLNIPLIILGG